MKLAEYTTITIPRGLVERSVASLQSMGVSAGPLGDLLVELHVSLNRDRHRQAIARIVALVGELGPGDLLEEVARALERPVEPITHIEALRIAVQLADSEQLDRIGDALGERRFMGVDDETHRRTVLRRLGDR